MSIRTKLFIFLLSIVMLMNLVTFFIYQSSRTIQNSYNLMMDRIFLYKQIANLTEDNLRHLSNYLVNQNQAAYTDFFNRKQELRELKDRLDSQHRNEQREVAEQNYSHLVQSFFEVEDAIIGILYNTESRSYAKQYEEMENIAGYIQEEGQRLLDQELSFYQPLYKQTLLYTGRMNGLGQWLLIVDLLLCIVFAFWLASSITSPIAKLVDAALQISRGNLDVSPPMTQQNDEIGILTRSFRHMLSSLKELIAKNLEMMEKDRLVKDLEIKALQSQINPHFLFNTLNVLSKLALIEGAMKTSDLTVSMSNLLRYNLRKLDTPVTLRDEVDYVKEYFTIQQARFRDRVLFEIDVDEELLDLPIPCLTLQPILENAFIHGIEGMEDGAHLRLEIFRDQDATVISISDNGVGMSEETRNSLLHFSSGFASDSPSGQSTGFGSRNVYRRLQLFYGQDDLLNIVSTREEGTTVTIRIPLLP
jgi:nitrogen fixation/metabolism regulation signal transduction histidine kinase